LESLAFFPNSLMNDFEMNMNKLLEQNSKVNWWKLKMVLAS